MEEKPTEGGRVKLQAKRTPQGTSALKRGHAHLASECAACVVSTSRACSSCLRLRSVHPILHIHC
eukprot:11640553-Alexandrium_andersonii.AAC.1